MANDKAVSEPVCLADRRGKSASRSQSIILLRTHWEKVTEFMVPLRKLKNAIKDKCRHIKIWSNIIDLSTRLMIRE